MVITVIIICHWGVFAPNQFHIERFSWSNKVNQISNYVNCTSRSLLFAQFPLKCFLQPEIFRYSDVSKTYIGRDSEMKNGNSNSHNNKNRFCMSRLLELSNDFVQFIIRFYANGVRLVGRERLLACDLRDIVLDANEHVLSTIFRFVTVKLSNPQ